MLIPVRCFTCGKPVSEHYDEFKKRVKDGEDPAKALTELGVTRYCCRRMFVATVDLIEEIIPYPRF
ncbi:MAG: DNA-directed RNA polymerase subunit N [Candidatus Micrarchaeota archaeon]